MQLVELYQVKEYLGITTCTDDVQMYRILDSVLDSIENMVGDLSYGEKTISVKNCNVKNNTFGLLHQGVTQITEINGEDFTTKVSGTDYRIMDNDTVTVLNLGDYTTNDFGVFYVSYISGWDVGEVPQDFVSIVSEMVGYYYTLELGGKTVTEEDLGPRRVKYGSGGTSTGDNTIKSLKKRLRKYLPLHLLVF